VQAPGSGEMARGTRPANRPFKTRSLAFKIFAVALVPLGYGTITGIALVVSAKAYWTLIAIGVVGAILSGYEHDEAAAAMCRGAISAGFFTCGLLGVLVVSGSTPKALLPPTSVFVPMNLIAGAILCCAAVWWRHRS